MAHPTPGPVAAENLPFPFIFFHRDLVVAALPRLLQLDSQPIHGNTAEERAGGASPSSEEEEEEELLPELRIPFTVDRGARVGTGPVAPAGSGLAVPRLP